MFRELSTCYGSLLLRDCSGFFASFTKKHDKSSRGSFHGKSIVRWCHAIAGVVVIGLMYTYVSRWNEDENHCLMTRYSEAWTGFDEWNTMQSTGTFAPDVVRYM